MTPENTYVHPKGGKFCRKCENFERYQRRAIAKGKPVPNMPPKERAALMAAWVSLGNLLGWPEVTR